MGGGVIPAPSAPAFFPTAAAPPTTLAIAALSARKAEGNSGTTPFTFTVTRSGNLAQATQVEWSVAGSGSKAAAATDFSGNRLPSGRVSFAVGETRKTITVNVVADTRREDGESFAVSLRNPLPTARITTAPALGATHPAARSARDQPGRPGGGPARRRPAGRSGGRELVGGAGQRQAGGHEPTRPAASSRHERA